MRFPDFAISRLIPILVLCAAGAAYWPFLGDAGMVTTDRDGLSMLGWLRATHNVIGWGSGYYVNSILTTLIAALLDVVGVGTDDYARAYRLLTGIALASLVGGTFWIVERATSSRLAAGAAAFAVVTSPILLRLTFRLEDSLIAQALQLQYLGIYLWYVARRRRERSGRAFGFGEVALALSLVLAVNAHHELNVLWATPLALLYFLRDVHAPRTILRCVAGVYGFSGVVFLALYVPLAVGWSGEFSLGRYVGWVVLWVFPNEFYRGYYFFNRFGWDLTRQMGEILTGLGQVVRVDGRANLALLVAYPVCLALLAGPVWRHVRGSSTAGVAALFVLVNVPHSLVYESANMERWGAPVVPAIVLMAVTATSVWRDERARGSRGRLAAGAMLCALGVIGVVNGTFYVQMLGRHAHAAADPAWQAVRPLLVSRVGPRAERLERRQVLLLADDEFERFFMVAAAYFNHRTDIFGITAEGDLYRSPTMFPSRRPVSRAAFIAETDDAELVASPATRPLLTRPGS